MFSHKNWNITFFKFLCRFFAITLVFSITSFFTPSFSMENILTLLLISISLLVLDYLIENVITYGMPKFVKGIAGFILACIALYIVHFLIEGYDIFWLAILIGALIYGLVDYFLPSYQKI